MILIKIKSEMNRRKLRMQNKKNQNINKIEKLYILTLYTSHLHTLIYFNILFLSSFAAHLLLLCVCAGCSGSRCRSRSRRCPYDDYRNIPVQLIWSQLT